MIEKIREDTVKFLLTVRPAQEVKRQQLAHARQEALRDIGSKGEKKQPIVKKASDKIGRNDPCPCGSGKKYKNCCGRNKGMDD